MGGTYCNSIVAKYAYFPDQPSQLGNPGWEGIVSRIEPRNWEDKMSDAAYHKNITWVPPVWYTAKQDAPLGQGWFIRVASAGIAAMGSPWESAEISGPRNRNTVYAAVLRKGSRVIYGLDQDLDAMDLVYFSDEESHLKDFINDFFPGKNHLTNVAIQQLM